MKIDTLRWEGIVLTEIGESLQVAGTSIGSGIVGCHAVKCPWVMECHGKPLHMDGKFLRQPPILFAAFTTPSANASPIPFAIGNSFNKFQ